MSGEQTVAARDAATDNTLDASNSGGFPQPSRALQRRPRERYERMGEVARGGMGRIIAARDLELGRMVAIKELLATDASLERRFEREVKITARLQHPGIIAVQEAGRWPDGEAFYVMPHIMGRPLDHEIARATTLPARLTYVAHVLAIADAIAYAHGQRVIHRDLKPSNVLIGQFGETIVIDWGLAKDLDDGDDAMSTSLDGTISSDVTVLGSAIGTPSYMPPEQGRGERVGPRADVYALGAILYHVLAGERPYRAARSASEVVDAVLAGPPTSLDELAPDAPADLRAIVAKAMARNPSERYATAAGLADDLRRYTTGQLVGAHRYSARQILARWLRRHRAVVAVGSLAVVALAVVGVIAVIGIRRERDDANARRAEVEGLLDFMLGDLHDKLKAVGKLDLLELVADKAVDYYDDRPLDHRDPGAVRRRGISQVRVGDIRIARGELEAGLAAYRGAIALLATAGFERDVAIAHDLVGDVLRTQGDVPGALAAYREALAIRTRLPATEPDLDHELTSSHDRIGRMLLAQGDLEGALDHRRQGLVIAERIAAAAPPDDASAGRALLVMHLSLAEVYDAQANYPDALTSVNRALELAERLVRAAPDDADKLRGLGVVLDRLGTIQAAAGDPVSALATQRRSLDAALRLSAIDPANMAWLADVATSHAALGQLQRSAGDGVGALASFRAALEIRERVAAIDPSDASAARMLANSHDLIANVELDAGALDAAQAGYHRAFEIRSRLAAASPDSVEAQRDLYLSHYKLAGVADERKDHAATRRSLDQALALARAAVQKFPDVPQLASDVARIEKALAELPALP